MKLLQGRYWNCSGVHCFARKGKGAFLCIGYNRVDRHFVFFTGPISARLGVPYVWRSRFEWHVLIPLRKVRNRIGCLFGRHFAWEQFYLSDGNGHLGPYAGVEQCISCGVERWEDWAKEMHHV